MVNEVYFVVPPGFDDPHRPSGGNVYDARLARDLPAAGWRVHPRPVPPCSLGETLNAVPDGSTVLVDGLVASAAEQVMLPHARRLRLVTLLHLPLGAAADGLGPGEVERETRREVGRETRRAETAVLQACRAVISTSEWTRRWLVTHYGLAPAAVWVARPGADAAPAVGGTVSGSELLCVGALTPVKGQDVLLAALATLRDLDWRCTLAGPVDRDAAFVARLCSQTQTGGIADRVRLVGPLANARLEATYAASDLLVLPSRMESYGMVVAEALAHGLPVLAAEVGGVREAFTGAPTGPPTGAPSRVGPGTEPAPGAEPAPGTEPEPGALVLADDSGSVAQALRAWLTEPQTRDRWREAARQRRNTVPRWTTTVEQVSHVLAEVSA